jgi:hypothetical protein
MKMTYLFRVPKFPILFSLQNRLICARLEEAFQSRIEKENLGEILCSGIDCKGEVWDLYTDRMCVSPSLSPRRWSKKKIIELYNKSDNCKILDFLYPEKSLSSKKFEKVFGDIFDLVE